MAKINKNKITVAGGNSTKTLPPVQRQYRTFGGMRQRGLIISTTIKKKMERIYIYIFIYIYMYIYIYIHIGLIISNTIRTAHLLYLHV